MIREHSGGSTVLLITHRLASVRYADRIYVLDHGQVVETGPPVQIFEAAATERLQRFLSQVL